jgi:regulator of replication initiation timing
MAVSGEVEELRKEVARLNIEVEMLKAKVLFCLGTVARLREELEGLKRRARRPSLREYMEALKAYDEVGAGEREPP